MLDEKSFRCLWKVSCQKFFFFFDIRLEIPSRAFKYILNLTVIIFVAIQALKASKIAIDTLILKMWSFSLAGVSENIPQCWRNFPANLARNWNLLFSKKSFLISLVEVCTGTGRKRFSDHLKLTTFNMIFMTFFLCLFCSREISRSARSDDSYRNQSNLPPIKLWTRWFYERS